MIVNQLVQFSEILSRISPILGQISLGLFMLILLFTVLTPLYLYVKLPGPFIPPATDRARAMTKRAKTGEKTLVKPGGWCRRAEGLEDVKTVIRQLDNKFDLSIRRSANRAFITTAVSQNGALDELFYRGFSSA